jgi:predicted lipoprotein with Yx(FWY)xxD motif
MKRQNLSRLALAGAIAFAAFAMPAMTHAQSAQPAEVKVAKTVLGDALVDVKGRTLYMFTKDTRDTSNCYDQCAVAWPPLLTTGAPKAGKGADAALIGTTTRKDGQVQVTYAGMPLYYWAQDKKAGDVLGQDVNKVWYVLAPDGSVNKQVKARVQVSKSPLGDILVGPNGRTLYMFTKDTKNTSNCYDTCETNWPPLLTDLPPAAAAGVKSNLLGTTERKDGKMQVTYAGMPLYYWAKDKAAGDITGQNVGEVWFVVKPDGKIIQRAAPVTAKIAIANTNLGNILVGPDGKTLYIFTKDEANKSNCYDQCAVNWPPLLTEAKPAAGDGADPALLGTTTRKDGTLQVTYKDMPLYYWLADQKPGDTTGENVGEVWFVLDAAGNIIKK